MMILCTGGHAVTEFYRVSPGVTEAYRVLPCPTESYRVLPSLTEYVFIVVERQGSRSPVLSVRSHDDNVQCTGDHAVGNPGQTHGRSADREFSNSEDRIKSHYDRNSHCSHRTKINLNSSMIHLNR
jgi:hypothetical protein